MAKISNLQLDKWINSFTGEIIDPDGFSKAIKEKLCIFFLDFHNYIEATTATASKKPKDYLNELGVALDHLNSIKNILATNPLLDYSRNHQDAFKSLDDLHLFFKNVSDNKISQLEKNMEDVSNIYGFIKNNSNQSIESAFEKQMDAYEDQYKPLKTTNKSQFRAALVLNIANVFLEFANRNTLTRTSDEISKRKTTPFKDLIIICFEVTGDKVAQSTLKKLLADVNKTII